ncbi:MAG: sugar ABC transporter permease [Fusobacteriaceae bacterium]|nr:sugar ABC transporter permease [Fusobacteriaceae bacterium]MBN2837704.1 sugar ABC transporter permease [Fusobacteriaceae bacterium]
MKKIKEILEKESVSAYLYLAPALILLAIFTFYPTIQLLINSFYNMDGMGTKEFIGINNYKNLFIDEEFWATVKNSFIFIGWSVPLGMSVGLALALLINNDLKAKGVFRTIFFSPVVTSLVAAGLIWVWLLNKDYGIVNTLLVKIGGEKIPWLTDERFAMKSVIAMTIWKDAGYNMILFLAGLNGINSSYYEASEIDGANKWQQFKDITWPLLMPTTLFVLVIRTIFSFRTFEQIFAMTKGGPTGSTTVFVYYIYKKAFNSFELGYASAAAIILLVLVLLLTLIQFKITKK